MKIESSGEESTHQDQDDGEDVTNTRNTTSVTGEGTAGESGDSSSDSSKRLRSIVWKFFSLLESRNQSNVSCVELETKMAYFYITKVQHRCVNILRDAILPHFQKQRI